MTLESLTWIVVTNGLVQLAGLIVLVRYHIAIIRDHREMVRLIRGTAGLVYQENEKTRARLDELFGGGSRYGLGRPLSSYGYVRTLGWAPAVRRRRTAVPDLVPRRAVRRRGLA